MNRQKWLANRKNYIGASEVAAVLGMDPYRTPATVWSAKVHGEPTDNDNDAMAFGRDVEDAIAKLYTRRTGVKLEGDSDPEVIHHPEYPWIGATLDRWTSESALRWGGESVLRMSERKIPYEIKNIGSWNWNEKYQTWEDDPPFHHVIQVQTQSNESFRMLMTIGIILRKWWRWWVMHMVRL